MVREKPTAAVRHLLAIPVAGAARLCMCGVVLYLFFCYFGRNILGDHRSQHAAIGLALHADSSAAEYAVGVQYATGKHATDAADRHAGVALDALRGIRAILYRGARIELVWSRFLAVTVIGGLFLALALARFRSVWSQSD